LLASQDNPEAFVSEWRQAIPLTAVAPSIGAPSRALAVCLGQALATRPAAAPHTAALQDRRLAEELIAERRAEAARE